ncbi:hypothetical protein [Fimbriimonas ginsengisoli]|uniref:Outer membrane protein beta-barrel domain-containing protein n=1 Tax=Fimbriimonas ginsengisoli Gsoil 348 TaxID=661478 RepID=A0A068NVV9_FIMGI|nr:hypothetical protein [Fimbriimonas ginsengisoli]AIE86925.1 hypothetical protein OP10G_3557 [Fimbriimonas ginsengisoli Gsoil 348]
MRKSWIAKAAVAASVLACVGVANAQTNGPSGISARIGVFFPTNDLARDIGKTWFAFGADYKLKEIPAPEANGHVSYISITGDYYEKDGVRAIPIALNYNIRVNQLVFSAGLGVDFVRIGTSSTGLSGQLGATYEFANSGSTSYNPFFVQAKYFFSSKSDLNGFGVYAGYRF